MRSMLLIALLTLAPAAYAADGPAPVPAPVDKPSAVADGDKLVCRRETTIGSNIPGKRVCKPRSQLLAEQAAAREAAKEMTAPTGAGSSSN